jgi:DNA primase
MATAVEYIKENLNAEMLKEITVRHGGRISNVSSYEIRSTCPLHGGDNGTAFVWNLENNMWYCFTGDCGGGDIFQFFAVLHDLSIVNDFKQIVNIAAEELGIDITNLSLGKRASKNKKELAAWLSYCGRRMAINTEFDPKRLGERFLLNDYRGFEAGFLKEHGVSYNKTLNRIQFNIYNENNTCVGAVLRRVDETDSKKWINRPKGLNSGELLYNLNNIPEEEIGVIIVEGVIDALNLIKLGINNVVCTFGAHLTEEQEELILRRFIVVTLMYDNDKAGLKATHSAIEMLKNKVSLYVSDMSQTGCKDPGELTEDTLKLVSYVPHWKLGV